jgi:2-aminoethylphosphonate-pyruvate transaminase
MVAPEVQLALIHKQICHRVPDFEDVIKNVQKNLLKVYKADDQYTTLLITGSGTAANETTISSAFCPTDKVLLVNNGVFGDRLEELFDIHGIPATVVRYEWGQRAVAADLEDALKQNPDITCIAMVCHETSTCIINPVKEVGELAKKYQKKFFVDAVSALGGEDLDVIRDNIDFCTCSSNKCLASLAGVGIICARKSALESLPDGKPRNAYLNLRSLYRFSRKLHQTPNTPSVTMFIALDAAVTRLLKEGLDNQIARHQRCAKTIRDGVRNMGLKTLVGDDIASNTVTSVFLPPDVDIDGFIQALEDKGFTVYPGKGPLLKNNMFQIANMGMINEEMCRLFLDTMSETLKEFSK